MSEEALRLARRQLAHENTRQIVERAEAFDAFLRDDQPTKVD